MNTRFHCPKCKQKEKTFSLYIAMETGEHLHPSVGRCNRESNCGYHYTPKQYFHDNNISLDTIKPKANNLKTVIPQPKPVSFIPVELFKSSLKGHETNHFVKYLIGLFGVDITKDLISSYFIGTSRYWKGATVFWQIDILGKVRTGKIMLYNDVTGKRIKEPFNHINWVHQVAKQPEFELKQCLFGEHLLKEKTKPVAIVESEKTAIISSIYLPQFIWLAVGSLNNLNAEKCQVLKGRNVTLFPDLNGFEKWNNKAKELSNIEVFTVSDLLERKATETERKKGFDLADYLIKYDYKKFELPETEHFERPLIDFKSFEQIETKRNFFKLEKIKSVSWDLEISKLEKYFSSITIPDKPIRLNSFSIITDVSKYIESHFEIAKANNGKQRFLPYLNRLRELKRILTTNLN
jgi:hypothetical protein